MKGNIYARLIAVILVVACAWALTGCAFTRATRSPDGTTTVLEVTGPFMKRTSLVDKDHFLDKNGVHHEIFFKKDAEGAVEEQSAFFKELINAGIKAGAAGAVPIP